MRAHISKIVPIGFHETIEKVTGLLQEQGFGIITQIDVTATFKAKLDVDFRPYRILGACNPAFAHKALTTDDKAGVMMPCNVIVQEHSDGKVEVSFVNADALTSTLGNKALEDFACEVMAALRRVYQKL
jgi:uncharacterized protein (DUF302 family)